MGLSPKDYRVVKSIEILKTDHPDQLAIEIHSVPETPQELQDNELQQHVFYMPLIGLVEFGTQLANLAEKYLGESLT